MVAVCFASSLLFAVAGPGCDAALAAGESNRVEYSDDFEKDTRSAYHLYGEITWLLRGVRIGPGSRLTKKVGIGATAELILTLELPQVGKGSKASETRIAFLVEGGETATVRITLEPIGTQGRAKFAITHTVTNAENKRVT